MEYDLQFRQVPSRLWVASLINQVHSKHFKECRTHRHLKYPDFKRKLIELYKRPDMTQTMLQNLLSVMQERDEPLETFADRVRELVDLAHPKMASDDKQRTAIAAFCRGLFDRSLAQYVAVSRERTLAGAVRVASAAGAFARIPVKARSNYDDSNSRKRDREYSAVCASQVGGQENEEEFGEHEHSCQCDSCYDQWLYENELAEHDNESTNDYYDNGEGAEQMLFVAGR